MQNQKVPGSNPARGTAELRDPTSLQDSQCLWVKYARRMSEAAPLIMVQSWPWGSQIAVKKIALSILLMIIISYFAGTFVL